MKIDSYMMSNEEVLRALRMFNDETWDDGKYHLVSVESIWEDGEKIEDFIKRNNESEIPEEILKQMYRFVMEFDNNWLVYVSYMDGEVFGIIAFSEWY